MKNKDPETIELMLHKQTNTMKKRKQKTDRVAGDYSVIVAIKKIDDS